MATETCSHKFAIICCLVLFSTYITASTDFPHSNNIPRFLKDASISSKEQQELFIKTVIPSYIQEFLEILDVNSTHSDLLQNEWFEGVSWDCKVQVKDWLTRLLPKYWNDIVKEEHKWVLQMIDAWGKIPEGIMSGHTNSHGDFDQCVQTEADTHQLVIPDSPLQYKFSGLYCRTYFVDFWSSMSNTPVPITIQQSSSWGNSTKIGIQKAVSIEKFLEMMLDIEHTSVPLIPLVGTCMPNVCTYSDVQQLLVNGMSKIYSALQLKDPTTGLWPFVQSCTDRHKPDLDAAAYAMIVILAIIVGLALVAGCIDYWQQHYRQDSSFTKNKAYKYLMAFSFYTNTIKLMNTRQGPEDLSCLHGIRFLSTAWVVLGHTYDTFMQGPQWNLVDLNDVYNKWAEITNLNGTFSVDTFFLMSGMLVAYNIFKMLEKTKGKINIPMLYLHRYIRLTPTYAILIGIIATLLTYTGSGPMWYSQETAEARCRKYWWTNLLYINNLIHNDENCMGASWYLPNDMQFFILSPFIVYPMWKWESMGTVLLGIYTTLACIAPVLVTRYANHALPGMALTRPGAFSPGFFEIYQKPWSRISTFLVGIWLGWLLHKTRGQRVKLPKLVALAFWLISTGTVLAVIYGIIPWFNPRNDIPTVAGYFYAGLSRFSFAVSVSWVIFACLKGYGGIVNEFLSWKAFVPLGRLCFCVYLVSFHLQDIFQSRLTIPIKYDRYTIVNLFFAHMVMSYLVGFVCTILFESPFIILQKHLFETAPKKVTPKELPAVENDVKTEEVTDKERNNNADLEDVKLS